MSAVATPLALKSAVWFTRKNVLWAVMFGMALSVLIFNDVPFLNSHHPYRPYQLKVSSVLVPHLILGCIAIFAGPIQFSSRLRRRYPKAHRVVGRLYVGSVLISAPLGIMIPFAGPKDHFFTIGVCVHGSAWFITTLMAFLTARNRQIAHHRQWMVRSYALTFSFVFARALGPLWGLITISEYGMADAIMTFMWVLGADIAFSWREITTSNSHKRATVHSNNV